MEKFVKNIRTFTLMHIRDLDIWYFWGQRERELNSHESGKWELYMTPKGGSSRVFIGEKDTEVLSVAQKREEFNIVMDKLISLQKDKLVHLESIDAKKKEREVQVRNVEFKNR